MSTSFISRHTRLPVPLDEEHIFPQPEASQRTLFDLQRSAVDEVLKSETGHLDLFLCFLLGVSLETNQILLKSLELQTEGDTESIQKTIQYIKDKLSPGNHGNQVFIVFLKQYSSEQCFNLLLCLMELNNNSPVEEIQSRTERKLTPGQCSALAYMLLMSEEVLGEFNMRKYSTTLEGGRRLVPVGRHCRKAMEVQGEFNLRKYSTTLEGGRRLVPVGKHCRKAMEVQEDCSLTTRCWVIVASALQLPGSHMRELDISHHVMIDSHLKLLSSGLRSPNCRLEFTDLSYVDTEKSGLDLLTSALGESLHSQLHTLRLVRCEVTSCGSLSLALAASQLEELHLSCNTLGDMGLKRLSAGLEDPHCQIQTLKLRQCNLSELSCEPLASVLCSNSTLRELDLRDNNLGDSGVELLSAVLGDPRCASQVLGLSGCLVTEEGCASLASVLRPNPSHLRELDLSFNHPGDSGVKLLSDRLKKLM
ncbi:ribonuclease inhibitor-like [Salvelinus fontinalis]|uniref:ribonuclease inhibitor-like n=1 Tax=Salvelinus fontinalis TaxID=8038 RepID=UPI00248638C2|nr:ribonuclease inhibitor-like [Salvelinus fontinalis]